MASVSSWASWLGEALTLIPRLLFYLAIIGYWKLSHLPILAKMRRGAMQVDAGIDMPKQRRFSWITQEKEEYSGDIYDSADWKDSVDQIDLQNQPYLTDTYEPNVTIDPDKSRIRGRIHDDP